MFRQGLSVAFRRASFRRGTAQDSSGNPLPLDQLEQRLVSAVGSV
jgi:hypothetical protein